MIVERGFAWTLVAAGLLVIAGCGSSSNGNSNCTTTTAGTGTGLGGGGTTCTNNNTGAASMCTATDQTDACTVCLAKNCCQQSLDCNAEAECSACTTTACLQADAPVGSALLNCGEASCKTACGI